MRRIVFVHAHPDDECLTTGGTLARYADEGAHVCLVTCTDGQLGEVAEVPELGPPDEIRERLAEVRREELGEACRRLGEIDLRLLGYHDSGMAETPGNDAPEAFVNQPLDDPAGRIATILRELRPQVLVTYNEYGFYGHPDHIRAHEAALRALELAADPEHAPEDGEPHRVAKLYYTAVPISRLLRAREVFGSDDDEQEERFTQEEVERIGTPDEEVTTAIDVTALVDRKFAALEAHRTQYGTTEGWLKIPTELRAEAMGVEHYVRVRSSVPGSAGTEEDLFEGVEET